MTTIVLKNNSSNAKQFLAFVRTLPYVDIIENRQDTTKKFKKAVSAALKKSEEGKDLVLCRNAEDMFTRLGV
jgi:cobyric acid synthase